jgi:DNA polymerase-3 subunit beta
VTVTHHGMVGGGDRTVLSDREGNGRMTDIIEHDITEDMVTVSGFAVDGAVLRELLTGALVGTGRDDTLPTLTGVLLEWESTELRAVSTDRYRLVVGAAYSDTTIHGVQSYRDVTSDGSALVQRRDVAELVKVLPKKYGVELARVTLVGDSIVFSNGDGVGAWSRTVPVLMGDFPRYRSLLPGPEKTGEVAGIRFNPTFMADAAKIPHDRNTPITWRFTGENRPAVASYDRTQNGVDWQYLLMPVRLTG